MKKIKSALISVFYKDGLGPIVQKLDGLGVTIYSTGGTQSFIEQLGIEVVPVESLTSYPSILGGRVKTLHPKVFGGILARRDHPTDLEQLSEYEIPEIDLTIVDLYPFEETVSSGADEQAIIEKIDIGGISLIRAAAKNYQDSLVVSSREQYGDLLELLESKNGATDQEDRKRFAANAFDISSHYDTEIFKYFNQGEQAPRFKHSLRVSKELRYGENPHQQACFYGDINEIFEKLNGKELSFNNLVDVDAAVHLISEFEGENAFVIIKHTNACGVALGSTTLESYKKALECDPVSAFGGILISNQVIDSETAEEIHKLFFEVLIAPGFEPEALDLLKGKKNRIILKHKKRLDSQQQFKSLLNGVILQDQDNHTENEDDCNVVTSATPSPDQMKALLFAGKIAKHTKSNTIVLATADQLCASGVGQTSRVDALNQAIHKAKSFGFDLSKAVMASDAFFPFPDCVEIAHGEGITSVIQPGGSIKDNLSIEFCDAHGMSMVTTGVRHFKH